MSNLLPSQKSVQAAIQNLAKKYGDQARTSMYAKVGVNNERACVTNGHSALFWPCNFKSGVYTLDGGALEGQFPDVDYVVPRLSETQSFSGVLNLPQGDKDNYSLLVAGGTPFWAIPATFRTYKDQHASSLFGGTGPTNTFDGKYLQLLAKFFESTTLYFTCFSEVSPVLITLSKPTEDFTKGKFAIMMGMRV